MTRDGKGMGARLPTAIVIMLQLIVCNWKETIFHAVTIVQLPILETNVN